MKNKLTLIALLFPLLVLTACNDVEDTKPKTQSEAAPKDQGCKRLCGTKLPKFMEAPKPNGTPGNTQP